jgi:L-amino acid N-acyltransferase YncA
MGQTMTDTEREIARATPNDVGGILDLQELNLSSSGGFLSVPFSRDWFEVAVANGEVIVARSNGRVAGYLVYCTFAAQAHVPLVQAMRKAYPGTPDSYNYGPICVAASERGRGLAGAMFAELRAQLPGREAVAFIRRDNTTSLLAHQKMGLQEVAEFTHDGVVFAVVVYRG